MSQHPLDEVIANFVVSSFLAGMRERERARTPPKPAHQVVVDGKLKTPAQLSSEKRAAAKAAVPDTFKRWLRETKGWGARKALPSWQDDAIVVEFASAPISVDVLDLPDAVARMEEALERTSRKGGG